MRQGFLLSPWATTTDSHGTKRILEINIDHPGNKETEVVDGREIKLFSYYSVAAPQQHSRIGAGVNWSIAEFQVDEVTFSNIESDPKYVILFEKKEEKLIHSSSKLTEISSWLQSNGVSIQDIASANIDDISGSREAIKNRIRQVAENL